MSLSVVDVMNDTDTERTITMTAEPTTHDLLIVACPKCHAEAASPCVTSTGKKSPVHSDRVKAAAEAAALAELDRQHDEAKAAVRKLSSHAGCDHASTKAARAACRRERAKLAATADNATDSRKAAIRAKKPAARKQSTEAMQRKMAAGLA
jgi:hypothetical protein